MAGCPQLSPTQRARLLGALGSYLDGDGVLHLFVQTHRSQFQNRQEALNRFQALLSKGLRPRKKRRPTKPSRAAKARRLTAKRQRGEQKRLRKRPRSEE